jgi:hypothetical protein
MLEAAAPLLSIVPVAHQNQILGLDSSMAVPPRTEALHSPPEATVAPSRPPAAARAHSPPALVNLPVAAQAHSPVPVHPPAQLKLEVLNSAAPFPDPVSQPLVPQDRVNLEALPSAGIKEDRDSDKTLLVHQVETEMSAATVSLHRAAVRMPTSSSARSSGKRTLPSSTSTFSG